MKDNKSDGFGLIGMALTLIVLSVIIANLMYLVPNRETISAEKTVAILNANKNALIGYAGSFRRLPPDPDTSYRNLVPSLLDGYQNATGYAYEAQLVNVNSICSITSTNITVTTPDVAFVIWSKGRNGVKDTPLTAGAQSGSVTITITSDDSFVWATLAELQAAAHCVE